MANISSDVRNYFKLELLLTRSHDPLRQLFKNRYSQFNGGQIWNDTPTCGTNYLTNVIKKNKKISLTKVQNISVSHGDSNEWDLTTINALLIFGDRPKTLNAAEIQQLDEEDKSLKQLREIRNNLAHHPSKSVATVEFNQLWTDLTAILVALGDIDTELDKLKDDSIFKAPTQVINEGNVKEASRLNSLGTQAHKDGKFSEAITLFTKAIVLPGVLDHDRAIFFSNMASTRLALYEQQAGSIGRFEIEDSKDERYRALQDAKKARNLWSSWWKGHLRVGKVYAALNEHEKAMNSFERALALDPTNAEIKKTLDENRVIHSQQLSHNDLNPELRPMSIPERLKEKQQKFGTDPDDTLLALRFLGEIDPVVADLTQGHRYEHGDIDVKQNYETAARYFSKAASQNNAEGLYNLARLTDLGLGVKKDHKLAQTFYEQAAAQPPMYSKLKKFRNPGVAEAEHALGLRYAEGIVVPKNVQTAVYWYERAIAHEYFQSANNLALMYYNGIGVQKSLDKAEQLFEMAAKKGDAIAMQSLAKMLLDKNELQMAKIWYDRACEAGNIITQNHRPMFEKLLQEKQQEIDQCPLKTVKRINATENVTELCQGKENVDKQTDQSHDNDYSILIEHANRVEHRKWQSRFLQASDSSFRPVAYITRKPRVPQRTVKSLLGLKPITIREMNPINDHVYEGYVLSVTIIGEAYSWKPSIHLLIEDEHLDCIKICVYGFPEDQGEYFTTKVFRIGSKMNIINPYLRIPPSGQIPVVRVDEFSSIMMQSESEYIVNMCRCCGEANALHACSKCKQARYCTKECQAIDWELYQHKLICKKQ
ncbi:unnamed protein product [Rotaria socialis]|uniref:MYND-type domain-containing protein n=1 Tax=Rotaria socialis TaxID=392032 RepID=A0A821L5L1_9BILA|nr:unnamed protein product [Rotaria socialis]